MEQLMRKLLVVLLLLAMCGCQPHHQVTSGTVIDRKFLPAHEENDDIYTGETIILNTKQVPDRWIILVKDGEGSTWINVSRAVYEKSNIGSHWER